MKKSISELDSADSINPDDILLISQKTDAGYISKKVMASNFKGEAGESGLPAIESFKAEQTKINANLQTSINSVSGGYFKAFDTLANLQAATGMTTGQVAKVMSDPNTVNNGDYRYNGTAWVKGYDALTDAKEYANNNAAFQPIILTTSVDFNTLKTYGFYIFNNGLNWNNSTNKPELNNQWAYIQVMPLKNNGIVQVAICANSSTIAMRLLDSDGKRWFDWQYFSNDATLSKAIKSSIKTNINEYIKAVFDSNSLNKLDPNNLLVGYEVHGVDIIAAEANSVTTNLIDVSNVISITVSGLQPNTQIGRYYHFLDASNKVLLTSDIGLATEKTISVPAGAVWFRMSLKQRNPNSLDISTAQIEYGNSKTNYVDFSQGDIVGLQGQHLKQNISSLTYAANGKNLFNKSTVMQGYEVYADGKVVQQPDSITTAPIDVSNLSNITISGLVQNPEIGRYVVFKDKNNTILLVTQIERTATVATLGVPTNAKTMQLSIKQRSSSIPDLNVVQIESGTNATPYENYTWGVAGINGLDIVKPSISTTKQSRAFGAKYLMFGDSITETSNVEQGIYTNTSYRSNWPRFAKDMLQMSDFKNYAKSGASFREYIGQLTWQKISHQVQTAINNNENPDIIVLACGTNDGTTNLGDYTTAMSKDIANLDMSLTADAMRYALYKIREKFPNATCFYSTQLQRADVETADRENANSLMVKLAKRYGFNVIDSMHESGIVKDFEVWQQNGRYLSDGLHPNFSGQQVQANYIVSEIAQRMMY